MNPSSGSIGRRYGYRRISAELTAMGLTCAPERVRRIMRERGLNGNRLSNPPGPEGAFHRS